MHCLNNNDLLSFVFVAEGDSDLDRKEVPNGGEWREDSTPAADAEGFGLPGRRQTPSRRPSVAAAAAAAAAAIPTAKAEKQQPYAATKVCVNRPRFRSYNLTHVMLMSAGVRGPGRGRGRDRGHRAAFEAARRALAAGARGAEAAAGLSRSTEIGLALLHSQVIRAQVALVGRYELPHEVIGTGADARLRILPAAAATGAA